MGIPFALSPLVDFLSREDADCLMTTRSDYPFPRGMGQLYEFTEPDIRRAVSAGGDVLDVGCGEGILAPLLFEEGAKRVVGFDISPDIIDVARQCWRKPEFLVGDAEDASFMAGLGKYDLVLVRNTFHHFHDKQRFLRLAPTLLKAGGTFLLIDLDHESNFSFAGVGATHLRFCCTHGLRTSLNLLAKTRLFLNKAMREHRQQDRNLLRQQGWFTSGQVERRLKEALPKVVYRRTGGILGYGGAYVATLRQEEITS